MLRINCQSLSEKICRFFILWYSWLELRRLLLLLFLRNRLFFRLFFRYRSRIHQIFHWRGLIIKWHTLFSLCHLWLRNYLMIILVLLMDFILCLIFSIRLNLLCLLLILDNFLLLNILVILILSDKWWLMGDFHNFHMLRVTSFIGIQGGAFETNCRRMILPVLSQFIYVCFHFIVTCSQFWIDISLKTGELSLHDFNIFRSFLA